MSAGQHWAEGAEPSDQGDQELRLWRALRHSGSVSARDQLVSMYLPLARQIARRHHRDRHGGDIEFSDLYQLACTGLLDATDRFDPDRGAPFRSYAARRISGSIIDGIGKMSEVRAQISSRNRARLERLRSVSPNDADRLSASEALQALSEMAAGLALGFMLDGTGLYQPDDSPSAFPNAYESLAWKETVEAVIAQVSALPEREQAIVRRHYVDGLTFEQIGALLGLSKGRVSQLHAVAMALLRKRLGKAGDGFHLRR